MMKIGHNHSNLMKIYFTKIESKGIDLGNVEIKESQTNTYKLKQSDLESEFILFYNHILERFYVCLTRDFKFNVKATYFRHTAILKRTKYSCKKEDYDLFYEIMNKILKNKSYIPEVFQI